MWGQQFGRKSQTNQKSEDKKEKGKAVKMGQKIAKKGPINGKGKMKVLGSSVEGDYYVGFLGSC